MGLFHTLDEELINSLILTCRWHAKEDMRDFNRVLKRQEEVSVLKIQFSKGKKMDVTKSQWIGAPYAHQKYNSLRCAMTAMQAFKEFNSLKSASAQNQWVKDQILIRYVGLGWEEAHHPWSKNKYVYTPAELLKHLSMVVTLLQQTKKVSDHLPMNLPTRLTKPTLGTRAADVVAMDKEYEDKSVQLRINAYLEQEQMEERGIGGQLSEMQQNSWKVFENQRIKMKPFKIEMLFEYKEPGGELRYNWCRGVVVELIKQNDKSTFVEIKWNNDTAGGLSTT